METAIASAAMRKLGASAELTVHLRRVTLPGEVTGSIFATLPPGARIGQPIRVLLKSIRPDGRVARFGDAECVIDARLEGVRTTRAVSRGQVLTTADVEPVTVSATGWPMRPLPRAVEGARALADLPAGQVLQTPMIAAVPLVRSGDEVTLTLVDGALRVETLAVATQAGQLGDVIRLVTSGTGRRVMARVVGRGAVEVRHGS